MLKVFQSPSQEENGDKTALYPKQTRPEGYVRPTAKTSKTAKGVGLFDLLKSDTQNNDQPKSGASAAFAAFAEVKKNTEANGGRRPTVANDFLSHWQNVTVAKKVEQESLTRRMDAVLKNVNMGGFKQASMARTWKMKTIWFGLIFIMFGIMIFEIAKCVQAYYESPVATTYTLETPDAVDFPQVYICFGNSFNRSYVLAHKDQMAIATAYRSRSAVTKGGNNRKKRDLSQTFNLDPDDLKTLSDDDIVSILRHSSDTPRDAESNRHRDRSSEEQDLDSPSDYASDNEIDNHSRIARQVSGSGAGGGNFSTNASKALALEKAKAAAAAEAQRIEALMNVANISEVVYQYFRDAAFKIDQTFLKCEFRSHQLEKLNCNDVIKPIMDANYGMCFLVDLPDDMKQVVAGDGLRLLINSHVNLYPRDNEGPPKYAGVLVSVNKQYDPFNWLKSLAAPGRMTKIDLEASHVQLLNLVSGPLIQPCVDDQAGQQLLRIFKANYSRTMCQMDCLYQAHRNFCQCILPVDKSQVKEEILNDTSFCGPTQFKGCLASSADKTDLVVQECRALCHTPCDSYRYEMRSSYAKLNQAAFAHLALPPNVTAQNLIELRVAYARKEIAQLVQSPSSSIADMIANMGGHINLWMGASMISLLQMIFMAAGFVIWRVYTQVHGKAVKK